MILQIICDCYISSHSVEDIFNEVITNMIKAEKNGSTINFPLAYSKLAARNTVSLY